MIPLAWCLLAAVCAAWFCADAVLGVLVAPQLFAQADAAGIPRAFAGQAFGEILLRWMLVSDLVVVGPACAILAGFTGYWLKRREWIPCAAAVLLCLGLFLAHHQARGLVVRGHAIAAELRERPDPERERAFREDFHRVARFWTGAEMALALAGLVWAATALARSGRRITPPSRTPPPA